MALRAGIRQSRGVSSLASALKSKSSLLNQKYLTSSYKFNQGHNYSNQGSNQEINWRLVLKYGAAAGLTGLTALALDNSVLKHELLAEDNRDVDKEITQELIDKENR
jgi:hypothetical protein